MPAIYDTEAWAKLQSHVTEIDKTHLRELLQVLPPAASATSLSENPLALLGCRSQQRTYSGVRWHSRGLLTQSCNFGNDGIAVRVGCRRRS